MSQMSQNRLFRCKKHLNFCLNFLLPDFYDLKNEFGRCLVWIVYKVQHFLMIWEEVSCFFCRLLWLAYYCCYPSCPRGLNHCTLLKIINWIRHVWRNDVRTNVQQVFSFGCVVFFVLGVTSLCAGKRAFFRGRLFRFIV